MCNYGKNRVMDMGIRLKNKRVTCRVIKKQTGRVTVRTSYPIEDPNIDRQQVSTFTVDHCSDGYCSPSLFRRRDQDCYIVHFSS